VVMNPDLTIRAAHKLAVLACKRIGTPFPHLSCPSTSLRLTLTWPALSCMWFRSPCLPL
jgi:hypothetical protein